MSKKLTLSERITSLEVLMKNHLKHHENLLKYFVSPIIVGLVLILAKLFFWSD